MLRLTLLAINVLCLLIIAGCSKENVIHGMYEGLRTRNDLQSSPSERIGRQSPDYQEYERMRKETRKEQQ